MMSEFDDLDLSKIDLSKLSVEEREELENLVLQMSKAREQKTVELYQPVPKQLEFHEAGAKYRERLLQAGNRVGKTFAAAHEVAYHLTGQYPSWWTGKRFDRPTRCWVAGKTSLAVRDTSQTLLFGAPMVEDALGTGTVPGDCLGKITPSRGIGGAYDNVTIKHVSGGWSQVTFMSYEMGREKWQGATLDFIWFDEEPPEDIYDEGKTRTSSIFGPVFMTFTPLKGESEIVKRFNSDARTKDMHVVHMTIYDAVHYTPERVEQILNQYPAYQRNCRAMGIPMAGEGRVFTVEESEFLVDPFEIPPHWWLIAGVDFGITHPMAWCCLAIDRDQNITYVIAEHRMKDATVATNAAAIKSRQQFAQVPVAWPHDGGTKKDTGSSGLVSTVDMYRQQGIKMLSGFAKTKEGSNNVEDSLAVINEELQQGRVKVFKTCTKWLEEYRKYHREKGQVFKIDDDLISAFRYAHMMRRKAKLAKECWSDTFGRRKGPRIAKGLDYDVFNYSKG